MLTLLITAPASAARLAVGAAAPNIVLADQYGEQVQLDDVLKRRRFAVVAFYVKAFTGG